MFILRKIPSAGGQINIILGKSYYLTHKDRDPKEFKNLHKVLYGDSEEPTIFAIIGYSGELIGLSETQTNYIMTDSGKTFANISK